MEPPVSPRPRGSMPLGRAPSPPEKIDTGLPAFCNQLPIGGENVFSSKRMVANPSRLPWTRNDPARGYHSPTRLAFPRLGDDIRGPSWGRVWLSLRG
jgi:hypothetical protein